jgi:hypothetical protein
VVLLARCLTYPHMGNSARPASPPTMSLGLGTGPLIGCLGHYHGMGPLAICYCMLSHAGIRVNLTRYCVCLVAVRIIPTQTQTGGRGRGSFWSFGGREVLRCSLCCSGLDPALVVCAERVSCFLEAHYQLANGRERGRFGGWRILRCSLFELRPCSDRLC